MNNFAGYWMKCGDCTFQSPAFKREGFKFAPYLISVADAAATADGKLAMKVLPHIRRKIWCSFPPMTPAQFKTYSDVLHLTETGTGMAISIQAYDIQSGTYITDTYYHTDIMWKPVIYKGQYMIQVDDFELIGH